MRLLPEKGGLNSSGWTQGEPSKQARGWEVVLSLESWWVEEVALHPYVSLELWMETSARDAELGVQRCR